MFNEQIQRQLAQRYASASIARRVKLAFVQQQLNEALQIAIQTEREESATVLFLDIDSFSSKIVGRTARSVRRFLDTFYAVAIPAIYRHRGMIDRIVGDGIVAIYSSFFEPGLTPAAAGRRALATAESVVAQLYGTQHESKAAISDGPLLFCKTGLAGIYQDYTVIGHPLTMAYRLEDRAHANQVLTPWESDLGQSILAQVDDDESSEDETSTTATTSGAGRWYVSTRTKDLKGIGQTLIVREEFRR